MTRRELGLRLMNWHSSMSDPIYAVGSFYFSGDVYPSKEVVEDCLSNLQKDLGQRKKMLAGHMVIVERGGKQVSLRKFAGYTNSQLREDIKDLEEIVSEVERFLTEDYANV
jgi:hypothetical protein